MYVPSAFVFGYQLLPHDYSSWKTVLIGLAVLAVVTLVASRLKWIQSRPIAACIVLSVLAHVLLIISAYTMKLFDRPRRPLDNTVVRVSLFADEGSERAEPDEMAKRPPWETFPVEDAFQIPSPPFPALSTPEMELEHDRRPPRIRRDDGAIVPPTQPLAVEPAATVMESPRTIEPDEPAVASRESTSRIEDGQRQAELPADNKLDERLVQPPRMLDATTASTDADAVTDSTDELPPINDSDFSSNETSRDAQVSTVVHRNEFHRREVTDDQRESQNNDEGWHGKIGGPDRPDSGEAGIVTDRRLLNGAEIPIVYRARVATNRMEIARRRGATDETERAVSLALAWLAANQKSDGLWDASETEAGRPSARVAGHDRGTAGIEADTGITGLGLLAFLGAGHTHLEGTHRVVVQSGLEYLLRSQRSNGNMAGRATPFAMMYCHAMATLAICEAYAMTGDTRLESPVRRAIDYTIQSQDPRTGSWRYGPRESGDMSQFGWQLMALYSAQQSGLPIPRQVRSRMERFVQLVSSGRHGGFAAYRPSQRGRPSVSMTAEALTCRCLLGMTNPPTVQEAERAIMRHLPGERQANLYYWYYGSLGLMLSGGDKWDSWNESLIRAILSLQRHDGPKRGSLDPKTVWGGHGGRVYSTALGTLCLEVYYRYLPSESY